MHYFYINGNELKIWLVSNAYFMFTYKGLVCFFCKCYIEILETTFRIVGKLLMNMGAPRQFHNVDIYT